MRCAVGYAYFAFGVQQLYSLATATMPDGVVFPFFIITQIIEARRGRRWRLRWGSHAGLVRLQLERHRLKLMDSKVTA